MEGGVEPPKDTVVVEIAKEEAKPEVKEEAAAAEKKKYPNLGQRWHHFRVLNAEQAILRGTSSTQDKKFKYMSRGRQESAASVVAIVCAHLFQPPDWTTCLVDKTLEFGDRVFRISVARSRLPPEAYLTTNLIQPEFYVGDFKVRICVDPGVVHGNLITEGVSAPKIFDGIAKFLELNCFGIVTTQGMSVAIWKHTTQGFFLYDPAPNDENGKRHREHDFVGYASVIRSDKIKGIIDAFCENLNFKHDSKYCIDRVTLVKYKPITRPGCDGKCPNPVCIPEKASETSMSKMIPPPVDPCDTDASKKDCTKTPKKRVAATIPPEDELEVIQKIPLKIEMTNYSIEARFANVPMIDQLLTDEKYDYEDTRVNVPETLRAVPNDSEAAILHGWTHAGHENYKYKEAAVPASCVAAVAYKKFFPVRSWTREDIDTVIKYGNSLYEEVKTAKPKIVQMTAADINDIKFKIEDTKIIIDTDMLTIVGTINSRDPAIIDLKHGLDEFFLKNTDGILESEPNTVAIWLENDYYYIFDAIRSDYNGLHLKKEVGGGAAKGGKKGGKDAKKEKGPMAKSCIMRFATQARLYARLIANVDPALSFSRFSIKRIGILDDIPGIRDWFDYKPGELGKNWILQGTINAESESLGEGSRGNQGIALHVAALVTYKLAQPKMWYKPEIDDSIREGDEYFQWCAPPQREDNSREDEKLTIKNIKKYMYYKNRKTEIKTTIGLVFGELEPKEDSKELNLADGLASFFSLTPGGIVECNDQFYALWSFEEKFKDGTSEIGYYVFVPQPTDVFMARFRKEPPDDEVNNEEDILMVDDSQLLPYASVLRFLDLKELANCLADLFSETNAEIIMPPEEEHLEEGQETTSRPTNAYLIHEVKVGSMSEPMSDEDVEKDKETLVMPELRAYTAKGEHGAVLLGSFVQSDATLFKRETRDKQQAACSIISLAFAKIFNAHLWKSEVIDDILRVGNRMTEDNAKNISESREDRGENEPRDYLFPNEIVREFKIGVNQIIFEVSENTMSGKLSDLTKGLEDFFFMRRMGVFKLEEIMMPLWREDTTETYFFLDPRGTEAGKAAAYFFMDLQEMANTIIKVTGREDPDEEAYRIDSILLENNVEESEHPEVDDISETHWFKFETVGEGLWKIDCNVKIEDERFKEEYRGRQRAAISVMAIVFSKVYEPRHWSQEVLDEVVITGNKLHARSAARLGYGDGLRPVDIVTEFFVSNRRIDLDIQDAVETGTVLSENPKVRGISCGVSHFFRKHTSGCLIVGEDHIFALWKFEDFIYFFDPGEILMRYEKIDDLIDKLKEFGDVDFEFTGIDVIDWNKLPPWKYDPSPAVRPSNLPPMNAYHSMPGKARAILRGSTHQAADIFSEDIRNRQTSANCMISLAMTLVKNPTQWTMKTLDEILVFGVTLLRDSMKHKPDKENRFKPVDLIRIFKMGANVFASDIHSNVVTGIVAHKPEPEETKGKKGKKEKKKAPPKKKAKQSNKRLPPPPPPPILLEEGLKKFFENNHAGILSTGRFMIALWRHSGVYFMFDPRPRTVHGFESDETDPDAKCCVVWYACLEPMFDHIAGNIPEAEKYGNFEFMSIILKSLIIEPLPVPAGYRPVMEDKMLLEQSDCPYPPVLPPECIDNRDKLKVDLESCFKRLDKELSIMLGTIHLSSSEFSPKYQDLQSTAVAMVVVAVSTLHAPSTWTPEMIDAILRNGHTYHIECERYHNPGKRNLSMEEVFDTFVVGDVRVTAWIFRDFTAGVTNQDDLCGALDLFFEKKNNSSGVFWTGNYAVGIVKHWGKYYFLDPTERNQFKKSMEGAACLVKCESIPKMAKTLIKILSLKHPTVYSLHVVQIEELHFFTQ